jgi:hypothetical protein
MNIDELRLEALRIAASKADALDGHAIVNAAEDFYTFLRGSESGPARPGDIQHTGRELVAFPSLLHEPVSNEAA